MRYFLFIIIMLLALPVRAQRDTINLVDWQFSRSSLTPSTATRGEGRWEAVALPHDFQIAQPWIAPSADEKANADDQNANTKSRLSARGFKEMGIGWYRRQITPDRAWRGRRVMLEVGGIMLVGDVYLNGERIGGTEYGYIGFGIDVSSKLIYGKENTIVVKADTRNADNSRWYTGGGLFRNVNLIITNRNVYFDRHPLKITTSGNDTVNITAIIAKHGKAKKVIATTDIFGMDGRLAVRSIDTLTFARQSRANEYALRRIVMPDPHLWDIENPYLYNMVVTIADADGKVLDRVSDHFGIRTIEFGPSFGFKLNGRKVLLKGIANHHTLGALGAAAFPRAIEKRIKLLKSFGFNHIRCSHNPYSEDLYRLADKYGMLVVDEIYDKWLTRFAGGRKPWMSHWEYDIPEWVERDRNHPSIIMWSLGNELQTYSSLPFGDWGVTPYRLLRTLLRRYDDTRPTTVAMHPRGRSFATDSLPCNLAMITDIQAYNYRYMYFPIDGRHYPWMTFYQSEANLAMMGPNWFGMDLERVIGAAYWGMIDYIGESLGWPRKGWDNGVFDTSLRPKPRAWLLKSMFTDEPVVHIGVIDSNNHGEEWNGISLGGVKMSDHWNRKEGGKLNIVVFTNCDSIELMLNGRSLGVKANDNDPDVRNQIHWNDITFEKGDLEAIGYKGGRAVKRHKIETAGEPQRLVIIPDSESWLHDGIDLMHVKINSVDSRGIICVQDSSTLAFDVEGDATIAALDNGNISSDESFVSSSPQHGVRKLYRGSALIILRAGKKGGRVKLNIKYNNRRKYEENYTFDGSSH